MRNILAIGAHPDDIEISCLGYLLKENNPCSRTVCSHYDLDAREYMSQADRPKPFAPHGAVDGIVCDSNMTKKMSFDARFGNSCGTPFVVSEYCKQHRQYERFCPFIKDRPTQPWTTFSSSKNKMKLTKKNKKEGHNTTVKSFIKQG